MRENLSTTRAALIAGLLAVLVAAVVFGVLATRPAQYEARVGIVAVPRSAADQSAQAFGPVVSLTVPGVVDLIRSPTAQAKVHRDVPDAPADLDAATTVGVVPGSGLVRIAVRAGSAGTAEAAVRSYQKTVVDARLLGQVGDLRPLGAPTVRRTAPDRTLGAGYGLAAGVAAGLIAFATLKLLVVDRDRRLRRGLVRAGVRGPVPVLHGRDDATLDRIAVLQRAAGRPVRVVPDGPALGPDAAAIESDLQHRAVPTTADGADPAAVVVVARAAGDGRGIAATAAVVAEPAAVVAVVALDDPPRPDEPDRAGEPDPADEIQVEEPDGADRDESVP